MYTAAPCNRCASTATSFPTCATSRCHCIAARGGSRGRIRATTSNASRQVLPKVSMALRLAHETGGGVDPLLVFSESKE